jgi:ATPase subunit of ABC transporter with duplicated ATPase domains
VSTATDAPQPTQRQDENLAGNFEQLNMRDSEIASSQASKNPGDTGTSSRRYQEAQLPTNKGNTKLGKAIKSHSLNPFTTPPQRPQSTPYSFSSGNPQLGIASNAPKPILIAVFGMTGTGKTTLIKNLAGNAAVELRTGHGLESCKMACNPVSDID